jgi:ATP-dependent Clp protease ATP-binding subunit ClpC
LRLAWSPDGGFLASSHHTGSNEKDIFRLWDTRHLFDPQHHPDAQAPTTQAPPPPALAHAATTLARLARLGIHPPLSLVQALDQALLPDPTATSARPDNLAQLRALPGIRALARLRWPRPARTGLLALLLHALPLDDWRPPSGLTPSLLARDLAAALAGEACPVTAPAVPVAALELACRHIDARQLALLALLGADAVAAEPGLPLRLAHQLPRLPALGEERRRLLGLRLRLDDGGRVQGSGAGIEHAGITLHGELRALLPSQLLLPWDLFHSRWTRRELLYRARIGQQPPRLRPTVLLLDVSPPCFGPVEAITRLAAHIAAATLIQAGQPVVLVTAGGNGTVEALTRRADLVAIWTRRSLDPAEPRVALATARAMARTLHDGGPDPALVLLTHAWFGADEERLPLPEGLRALFVQYPGQQVTPPLAPGCARWETLASGTTDGLEQVMGRLVG